MKNYDYDVFISWAYSARNKLDLPDAFVALGFIQGILDREYGLVSFCSAYGEDCFKYMDYDEIMNFCYQEQSKSRLVLGFFDMDFDKSGMINELNLAIRNNQDVIIASSVGNQWQKLWPNYDIARVREVLEFQGTLQKNSINGLINIIKQSNVLRNMRR